MTLHGVIFDLGGTLLHYTAPGGSWEDTEKTGAKAVYDLLYEAGYPLPPLVQALATAWDQALAMWSRLIRTPDTSDLYLNRQLGLLARRWGVDGIPPEMLDALAGAYMAAIQSYVRPLDGAVDTLRGLRGRGLRTGLISNTIWPGSSHRRDLDRYGLTPYLDDQVFSADAGAWKPHRDIFEMELTALALKPEEAIFVGDSLYFDVWGAQQAGLRGVWIEQKVRWLPDGLEVTPDAIIQNLPELLDVIETWR
ncbi:MAG TPA: HAD family hydrolase [Aggregatilineaceae bacterium]|nr:HAD family hydrolase [Aggregatilineaceae bacterium]